jgi:hypothetical protein
MNPRAAAVDDALRCRSSLPAPAGRSAYGSVRGRQLTDEGLDPALDVVTDGTHLVDALACGVVERPVLVAFAG